MYLHFLVALDDTELAITTASRALTLAKSVGARVTFFHAVPDWASTVDGALYRNASPEDFHERAKGHGNAILAKAAVAADALGVIYHTAFTLSDQPAVAILNAAHEHHCDLIFVCSHGPRAGIRGWFHRSQTQALVRLADLPVLVAAVEKNEADIDANRAQAIIRNEHRAIGAVLRGMQRVAQTAQEQSGTLEVTLMWRMIDYLREFPAKLHHPKEELHLFSRLRGRTADLDATLHQLELQHRREAGLVDSVALTLQRYGANEPRALADMIAAIDQLAGMQWDHMRQEEQVVLPAAYELLRDDEWREIANAFAAHRDPLAMNGEPPLDRLFTDIANRLARVESGDTTLASNVKHAQQV